MCHHRKYRVASGPCKADVGPGEVELHVEVVRPDDDGDDFDDDDDDDDAELSFLVSVVMKRIWINIRTQSIGFLFFQKK